MKIYTDLKEFPTLDDYIGKDVWVLCDTLGRAAPGFYTRVLSSDGNGNYTVNMIPEGYVKQLLDPDNEDSFYIERIIAYANTPAEVDDLTVFVPVHEITSDELFENILPEQQAYLKKHRLFERLAGTDMWIHVKSNVSGTSYYTNVVSIDGDEYYGYDVRFSDSNLSYQNEEALEILRDVYSGEAEEHFTLYPQSIMSTRIFEPYELVSTEELLQYFEDKVGTTSEGN